MRKRGWLALLVVAPLLGPGSCGDDSCPDAYVVVDDTCVPEAIASQCHFTGSSAPGESCQQTEDCSGCFVVCINLACFEQLLGGEACDHDLECRSRGCEANVCVQE